MSQFPLTYLPGVVADDTVLAKAGRYIDANGVRWTRADAGQPFLPQLIGGWERLTLTAITGICRTVFAWTDNSDRLNIVFGTHSDLLLWRDGQLYDITPYGPPARLAENALTSANASGTVTVAHTAHGYANGIDVKLYGAETFNGLDAANLNGVRTITVTGVDSYTFTAGAADTASASGTGGGASLVVVPQTELPAGEIDSAGGAGYGAGAYGAGAYGSPSSDDYWPRTWSFGLLGEALVASPRNGAIYMWENDTAARAAWLENSPLQNTAILTTPERVILALGTEEEVGHAFNARCIRHSDPRDETTWHTDTDTLAREKILEGAGKLIAGRNAGPGGFVWTDNEVYGLRYVGALDEVYAFDRLGEDCGLAGPNAASVKGQRATWLTPDVQFFSCALGSEPIPVECPLVQELRDNLATSQRAKIVVSTLSAYQELWCFYPDSRDGSENSRAIFHSPAAGWWSKAELARTAFCDSGPSDYPIGVDGDGNAFWHERGRSNDGNAISWSLRAGPRYIDNAERSIFLRTFRPDFKDQRGAITLTIYGREDPQGEDAVLSTSTLLPAPDTTKADLHVEAPIISWQISGSSAPASWRLGTPMVEGKATRRVK